MRQKWRHHCRAKNGDKFALSLALIVSPSHFLSLPSRRGHQRRKWRHHCRAKIGNKFALSLAKNSHLSFPPSHFPSLPSRRGHLYETSKNSIKLLPKTIGNRKKDFAWGCASVKKLKKNQLLSTNHHQAKQIWVLMVCAQQLIFFNFLTPAHPYAQSLFLFPIVFGINTPSSESERIRDDLREWWCFGSLICQWSVKF